MIHYCSLWTFINNTSPSSTILHHQQQTFTSSNTFDHYSLSTVPSVLVFSACHGWEQPCLWMMGMVGNCLIGVRITWSPNQLGQNPQRRKSVTRPFLWMGKTVIPGIPENRRSSLSLLSTRCLQPWWYSFSPWTFTNPRSTSPKKVLNRLVGVWLLPLIIEQLWIIVSNHEPWSTNINHHWSKTTVRWVWRKTGQ